MIGDGVEAGYLSKYLVDRGIAGQEDVAVVFTVYGIAVAIAAWLSGALSDLWGPRRVVAIGLAIWGVFEVGFLLLGIAPGNYTLLLLMYAVRGFGYPLFAYGFLRGGTPAPPGDRRRLVLVCPDRRLAHLGSTVRQLLHTPDRPLPNTLVFTGARPSRRRYCAAGASRTNRETTVGTGGRAPTSNAPFKRVHCLAKAKNCHRMRRPHHQHGAPVWFPRFPALLLHADDRLRNGPVAPPAQLHVLQQHYLELAVRHHRRPIRLETNRCLLWRNRFGHHNAAALLRAPHVRGQLPARRSWPRSSTAPLSPGTCPCRR